MTDHAGTKPGYRLLEVEDMTVSFGGVRALRSVTMGVGQGEIIGVVGPNGAGKSTLLNGICGLVDTQVSRIALSGEDIHTLAPYQRASRGVGRSFQHPQLLDSEDIFENLKCGVEPVRTAGFFAELLNRRHASDEEVEASERARYVAQLFGLLSGGDSSVGAMPFGRQKVLDIARAAMQWPDLLLLDEPSTGLETTETRELGDTLRQLMRDRDNELGILMVEHDVDLVRAICDEIIVLEAGQLVDQGAPEKVLQAVEERAMNDSPLLSSGAEDPGSRTLEAFDHGQGQ